MELNILFKVNYYNINLLISNKEVHSYNKRLAEKYHKIRKKSIFYIKNSFGNMWKKIKN